MTDFPELFRRYPTQLWYIFLPAAFFFIFMVVYQPFGSAEALDMGRGLFIVNVALLTSIVLVLLLISRTLFFLLSKYVCHNWWQFLGWTMLELTVLTYFLALYVYLVGGRQVPYFQELAICLQYSFLVLMYPYFGITVVGVIVARQSADSGRGDIIRFTDANHQVKIMLQKDAILYIQADENYIKIYYLDNGKVKEYVLRSTMSAIEPLMNRFGLFRCHRSYYINTTHILALRKDPYDMISAELDVQNLKIPVSKRLYHALSDRL